ncbi:MAG: glycosyltransferase family 4 protein [Lewinella sp.]|nr:glycosyltransferase family 4 protein [Lewinella sp.]
MAKLLLVANSAWNLAHYRRPWIEGLRTAGYEVHTAAPPDAYVEALEALTATTHYQLPPFSGRSWWVLLGLYKRLKPALVIHFTLLPNVYGGLLARCLGRPYLAVITGLGSAFLGFWPRRYLAILGYRLALGGAKCIIFYNQADREAFQGWSIGQGVATALIPGSGVDLQHFCSLPLPPLKEGLRLLYLGRFLADKGLVELLTALRWAPKVVFLFWLTAGGSLGRR